MAARRKQAATEEVIVEEVKDREYAPEDLIPCRSITNGTLIISGEATKSGAIYEWAQYGDVREVEYQDLIHMRQRHSAFIYRPTFVIEDEELLAQPRWRDISALYKELYSVADVKKLIAADITTIRRAVEKLNPLVKLSLAEQAADMIEEGKLDSIAKIKLLDEICGTELYKLAFKK